jgi:hypothetical protein
LTALPTVPATDGPWEPHRPEEVALSEGEC